MPISMRKDTIQRRELLAFFAASTALLIPEPLFAAALPKAAAVQLNMGGLSITEKMMHSTVRIYCPIDSTHASVGTGFIFNFPGLNNLVYPSIVTNKHVLSGFAKCIFTLTGTHSDGAPDLAKHYNISIPNLPQQWVGHPDPQIDLAVLPIGAILNQMSQKNTPAFYAALDESIIPSEDAMKNLTPLEPLVTVGYPEGIMDETNNLPIFHRGAAASAPYVDFQGRPDFLIDIATWPGSSGSPVFLYESGAIFDPRTGTTMMGGERVMFLGVIYKDFEKNTAGQIEVQNIPSQFEPGERNPMNIGMCIKSKCLLDFNAIFSKIKAS